MTAPPVLDARRTLQLFWRKRSFVCVTTGLVKLMDHPDAVTVRRATAKMYKQHKKRREELYAMNAKKPNVPYRSAFRNGRARIWYAR